MISRFTSRELERVSESFFQDHWTVPPEVPVNIEFIIEKDFNIDIIPHPHLKNFGRKGVEGLPVREVLSGHWSIWIAQDLMDNEARYRFTLAEELSHYLLHRKLAERHENLESYLAEYEAIPEEDYEIMDWNAKHLAAKLLVPAAHFREKVMDLTKRNLNALPPHSELILEATLRDLSGLYRVSTAVLRRRLREEDVKMWAWVLNEVREAQSN